MKRLTTFYLEDYIFCSGCRQSIQPKIIAESQSDDEFADIEIRDVFASDNYEKIGEEYVKSTPIPLDKTTFFVQCPVQTCKKEYLVIKKEPKNPDFKNTNMFKPEIIPQSDDWHLFPIENPIESKGFVIPTQPYDLYKKAITCLNLDFKIPCGFLIGAVIESICVVEKIKPITFEKKKQKEISKGKYKEGKKIEVKLSEMIPDLVKEKSLTSEFTTILETLSKVRNESAHPDEIIQDIGYEELSLSIKSIEDIFNELYIDDYLKRTRRDKFRQSSTSIREGLDKRRRYAS